VKTPPPATRKIGFACRRLAHAPDAGQADEALLVWRVLWHATAAVGLIAFVTLLFTLLGVGLGTWIS
jgi:hypothetical protein